MAKKRLNKKIAIIGSILLTILILAVIMVFLRLGQDPEDFIKDAKTALDLPQKDYDTAEKAYKQAYKYAKNKELKIDVLFKLAEMYEETNNWPGVAGCWTKIITIDTSNVPAREGLLNYSYQLADSGNWGAWRNVDSSTTELIDRGLDTSPRVYIRKGRAIMELTRQGQNPDPEKSINEAIGYFEKVRKSEPNNVDVYMYLAQAAGIKGQVYVNKGVPNARENADKEAEDILRQGVENAPQEPEAHINYLMAKYRKAASDEQIYRRHETELIALSKKFPDSAMVYFALAQLHQKNIESINRAISEIEKACELQNENVSYAIFAANLYYRRYSVYNDNADIYRAIDMAEKALTLPESQDIPGPRSRINYINRFSLHSFLANAYLEQAMLADETQKSKWVKLAEKEVHQITQLLGSGENPYTIMWKGRLTLVKGDHNSAIQQMYAAYDKLALTRKSASASVPTIDRQLGQLAYTLAGVYMQTNEIGAAAEFLVTAINNGAYYSKPNVLLDYADVSLAMRKWTAVINAVEVFEKYYSPTNRSRELRVKANIGARLFEQAEEELAAMDAAEPNAATLNFELNQAKILRITREIGQLEKQTKETGITDSSYNSLKDELKQLRAGQERLLDGLFKTAPDSISESMILTLSGYYMSEARNEDSARLLDRYLQYRPDSVAVKIYKKMVAEPDILNIPPERVKQITESVLNSIADTSKRNTALAQNYHARGQLDKATELYEKILEAEPDNATVIGALFDIALTQADAKQIRRLTDMAQKKNIDNCNGDYFAARAAIAQKDYKRAVEKLDSCLNKRPIFSGAYMLRSTVNLALDKEAEAIADIKKAFELNPLNGAIAKNRASVLYQRDKKLGSNVSSNQTAQTREALIQAIALNQTDLQLQSFYAEYISETDPAKALAIRQQLQVIMPSVANAVLLGNMAHKIAQNQSDQSNKQALLDIAEDAYKKALEIEPANELVLNIYSEFLRTLGRGDEAKKLLSQNESALWKYYLRDGQLDKAKEILSKLYQAQPQDANLVFGMLEVARKNVDKDAIIKYSDRLLNLRNTRENQLIQMQTFLEIGMIAEAEEKLKDFRKDNPDDFSSLFLDALLTAKKGQFEKALELTNQALEAQPDTANLWRLRGQINAGLNNFKEAVNDFQKSKSLQDIAEVRVDLARAYLKSNRIDDAVTELKKAIEKEQSPLGARGLLEQVYMNSNTLDKLKAFYNENIEKFPDFGYWYGQAARLAMNEKDYPKASQLFQKAWDDSVKKFGGDARILDGMLQNLLLSKQNEKLLSLAAKFIDGPFASIAYARMAEVKFSLGDRKTAIQYYRKALEKAQTNTDMIISVLGKMSKTVGFQEAFKWCNEKLQADAQSLQINAAIAIVYEMNKEYNKAVTYFDKSIQIASAKNLPTYSYSIRKTTLLQMLYAKTSDKAYLDEAVKEYESMLEKQPNNITVLNNLAYLLIENSEESDRALEYAQRAYRALPNNPDIIDTYGYILLKKEQYAKAEELFQMAVQLFEQYKVTAPSEPYEHLGMVKEKLDKYSDAIKAYKMALETGKNQISEETKRRLQAAILKLSEKIQNSD